MKKIILAGLTYAITAFTTFAGAEGVELNKISSTAKAEGGSSERKSTTYTQSKVSTRGTTSAAASTYLASRPTTTSSSPVATLRRVNLRRPTATTSPSTPAPAATNRLGTQ